MTSAAASAQTDLTLDIDAAWPMTDSELAELRRKAEELVAVEQTIADATRRSTQLRVELLGMLDRAGERRLTVPGGMVVFMSTPLRAVGDTLVTAGADSIRVHLHNPLGGTVSAPRRRRSTPPRRV